MNNIYSSGHTKFIDSVILKKRQEVLKIINSCIVNLDIYDALDIGTTKDVDNKSSNFIIKNLNNIKKFKSISDQNLNDNFFEKILKKSITKDYSSEETSTYKSDLVLSNATIEHVGNYNNQVQMVKNMNKLSKKVFIIITPNRYHPIDFHSKLPFIHWLPKKIHRFILKVLTFRDLSKEENLNLLSEGDLKKIFKDSKIEKYKIFYVRLFGFKSNLIFIGKAK